MASVLLIEDHPNQRLLYQIELEDRGHQVEAPNSIQDALNLIHKSPPDLVILDPYLSDYRRTEALKEIKEIAPELPVIVYTGDTLFEDDCRYFLADAFLTKSSDVSILLRTVSRLLTPSPKQQKMEMWAY